MPASSKTKIVTHGDQHGIVAGRDVQVTYSSSFISQRIEATQSDFFEPSLGHARPPKHPILPIARQLSERLSQTRLLALGGHSLTEKESLALHVAWLLQATHDSVSADRKLAVQQSSEPVTRGSLRLALRRVSTATLFILTDSKPDDFGYNLAQLHRDLEETNHWAIVTTESAASQWGIEKSAAGSDLWFDSPTEEVYTTAYLSSFLERSLRSVGRRVPEVIEKANIIFDEEPSLAGLGLSVVAARLKSPATIRSFTDWLATDHLIEPLSVRQKTDQLGGEIGAIAQWYRGLARRDQLLTIGLSLFDRLFADQSFAIMEELVDSAWRSRDRQLRHFDYFELEHVRACFKDSGWDAGARKIESRSHETRETILRIAWSLHRRSLLASLPLMETMVRSSLIDSPAQESEELELLNVVKQSGRDANAKGSRNETQEKPNGQAIGKGKEEKYDWGLSGHNRELWGSPLRGRMLRDSIGNALSLIGAFSPDDVDPSLRNLACDPDARVQIIAAEALASWRHPSQRGSLDDELFKKLEEWNDKAHLDAVFDRLASHSLAEALKKMEWLRATVAMAVAFSARYDPPDQLEPRLLRFFEQFIDDRSQVVRQRLCDVTLPLIVNMHVKQLEPVLREQIILHHDLRIGVAKGLANALELRTEDALEVMDDWAARCRSQRLGGQADAMPEDRHAMLAVIIMAYGYFDSGAFPEILGLEVIFAKLKRIMAEESVLLLRELAIWSALAQLDHHFLEAEILMQSFIQEVSFAERAQVVRGLSWIYLRQRARLEGGDETLILGNVGYAIWTMSERPLTQAELSLRRWLQDENGPVAQQLALQSLVAFRSTELEIKERAAIGHASGYTRSLRTFSQALPQLKVGGRIREQSFSGKLVTTLAIPDVKKLKLRINTLFPELTIQLRSSKQTAVLLSKWLRDTDRGLVQIARYLRRCLLTRNALRWLVAVVVLVLIALGGRALMDRTSQEHGAGEAKVGPQRSIK